MRVIVHDKKTSVHYGRAYERNVVEQVDGLFNTGRSVYVAAE